jgi:lipopolysaccharide transport system ATP-binding protein
MRPWRCNLADFQIGQNNSKGAGAMTKTPVLEMSHVGFYYQKQRSLFSKEKFWALKDVSFSLHKGESLGVIGRNGAGKSTLLRLLAGIVNPDAGTVVNHGFTTSLLSLQAGFAPYLSGRDNTIISGLTLGIPKKIINAKMESIKEFSGLDGFFEQSVNSYSSGMKARLGFSIAYQLDPDVLLIDEVLGVGDELFKQKSSAAMKEKIRSNKTVVLVTHAASTIRELCDRAVWIEEGVTRSVGKAGDVLREYMDFVNTGGKK